MQTIPMDLDGAFVVNRPRTPVPTPARYAKDVAAAFPELGECGLADVHGAVVTGLRVMASRKDPGPLPSYKVKSRIKSRRQKKGRRRR